MGGETGPLPELVRAVLQERELRRETRRVTRRLKRWARANAIRLRKQQRG